MRGRVGPNFVVGVRLSRRRAGAGSLAAADACALAQVLEAGGASRLPQHQHRRMGGARVDRPRRRLRTGANLDVAAAVKRATTLPVLVAGRVAQPAEAERALATGSADMVARRALIADPQWLAKGVAGEDATRPCTYFNE